LILHFIFFAIKGLSLLIINFIGNAIIPPFIQVAYNQKDGSNRSKTYNIKAILIQATNDPTCVKILNNRSKIGLNS